MRCIIGGVLIFATTSLSGASTERLVMRVTPLVAYAPTVLIVQTRIDMGPDGMGEMASPLTAVPSSEPGVYAFKTDLAMEGRWLLSIAAKVQGEPETVVGKITFKATR